MSTEYPHHSATCRLNDTFPHGLQQTTDFHFSVDALLLAAFAHAGGPARRGADVGAGCGVAGLGLSLLQPDLHMLALECDGELAIAARANALSLEVSTRYTMQLCDVTDAAWRRSVRHEQRDMVICNPPWRLRHAQRMPASPRRQRALFGEADTLQLFARAGAALLRRGGRLALVFGAERLPHMLAALTAAHCSASRLRMVHPEPGNPAVFALIEARHAVQAHLCVEPALYLHAPYTAPSAHAPPTARAFSPAAQTFCPWLACTALG